MVQANKVPSARVSAADRSAFRPPAPGAVRAAASPRQAARLRRPIDDALDARIFAALADPTRLRLLACLAKCARPCAVGEVADCTEVDLSVVSRHLRALEQAGVLGSVKQGRSVLYQVRFDQLSGMLRAVADALDLCRAGCRCTCGQGSGKGACAGGACGC